MAASLGAAAGRHFTKPQRNPLMLAAFAPTSVRSLFPPANWHGIKIDEAARPAGLVNVGRFWDVTDAMLSTDDRVFAEMFFRDAGHGYDEFGFHPKTARWGIKAPRIQPRFTLAVT